MRPVPCIVAGTGDVARCKCIPKKVFDTGTKVPTVNEALPTLALFACAMAVTVWLPMRDGAVYSPADEIVPMVEFPPAIPSTLQVTFWLVLPVTVAPNCWVALNAMEALAGVIETVGGETVRFPVAMNWPAFHVASIALEPPATPKARPLLLTVATPGFKELQVTMPVTFTELPSL
jgi:hypothetical protein